MDDHKDAKDDYGSLEPLLREDSVVEEENDNLSESLDYGVENLIDIHDLSVLASILGYERKENLQ